MNYVRTFLTNSNELAKILNGTNTDMTYTYAMQFLTRHQRSQLVSFKKNPKQKDVNAVISFVYSNQGVAFHLQLPDESLKISINALKSTNLVCSSSSVKALSSARNHLTRSKLVRSNSEPMSHIRASYSKQSKSTLPSHMSASTARALLPKNNLNIR